jgi:hypothetical protein
VNALFSPDDRRLLLGLTKKMNSEVVYNSYSNMIYWLDEYPLDVIGELRDFDNYSSLLRERSRRWFNRQLRRPTVITDQQDVAVWDWAEQHLTGWIGFSRKELSAFEVERVVSLIEEANRSSNP